ASRSTTRRTRPAWATWCASSKRARCPRRSAGAFRKSSRRRNSVAIAPVVQFCVEVAEFGGLSLPAQEAARMNRAALRNGHFAAKSAPQHRDFAAGKVGGILKVGQKETRLKVAGNTGGEELPVIPVGGGDHRQQGALAG